MNKVKLLILFPAMFVCAALNAQTQQGYVKTLGRPDKKGEPLSGVSVRAKGEHNPVLSKEDGTLTLLLAGKKNGDTYALQEVQKKGYELNEKGVIGRQYAYSDRVPLTIVMVSSVQLHADKQRIENNAYKVAEKNYKAKLDFLESQKADNAITEEQYRKKLLELQDKFEKYQLLIDGLAEHYAHVDYDELNDKEREVNICIENGELERADSLIKIMFDPIDALKRNKEALAQLNQQIVEANTIIDNANEDMAAVLKQQEKDANNLYQLYTIALSRFDNDKAGQYIETRAELDTTNIQWQIDAVEFLRDYMNDFDKSRQLCQKAMIYAKSNFDEHYGIIAELYNELGLIDASQSRYIDALFNLQESIKMREVIFECSLKELAKNYNNLGFVYNSQANYNQALESFYKALNLWNPSSNQKDEMVITCYNNIGNVYCNLAIYDKALEYLRKALSVQEDLFGEYHPNTGGYYSNVGMVYCNLGEYEKAQEYSEKSARILKVVFGDNHIMLANTYNNLGLICKNRGLYDAALDYYKKALEICLPILGEDNNFVGSIYNNYGHLFYTLGDDEKAFDYLKKGLEIRKKIYSSNPNHPEIATSYDNIANVCCRQNEYKIALDLYEKALEIKQKSFEKANASIAISYNNIGYVYENMGKAKKALSYFNRSLKLRLATFGEMHPSVASSYINLGSLYLKEKDYSKAIDYTTKALEINIEAFGNDHPEVGKSYNNLGYIYHQMNDAGNALTNYKRAYDILIHFIPADHPHIKTLQNNIDNLLFTKE